jgi:hypothetical protein
MRYLIKLAYDGTNFIAGKSRRRPQHPVILEKALAIFTERKLQWWQQAELTPECMLWGNMLILIMRAGCNPGNPFGF